MKPYKGRVELTQPNKRGFVTPKEGTVTIQAVYYSSTDPNKHLHLFDKDGDPIVFPIPGQLPAKITTVEPITVQLPLEYEDEGGGNYAIVYGVLE